MRAPGGERGGLERAEPGETTRDEGERPSATRAGRVPVRMCADAGAFRPPTRATEAFAAMRRTPPTRCAFAATAMFAMLAVRAAIVRSTLSELEVECSASRACFASAESARLPERARDVVRRARETDAKWIDPFVLVFCRFRLTEQTV
jgi:hypothetical protein